MKVKTAELTGPALDWVVAQVVLADLQRTYGEPVFDPKTKRIYQTQGLRQIGVNYSPSTNWTQGGPIIERERIKVAPNLGGSWHGQIRHEKEHPAVPYKVLTGWTNKHGPTPLIAAMRCFCASKLGEEVELPEKLK